MARKILLAGMGAVGQRHARNLRTLLGNELELLAYRTQRSSQVLTDRMQIESGADLVSRFDLKVFTDLDDALREKPEAVIISNPTSLHLEVAMKAAEAGCHLFVEKPLSHSMDRVQPLIDLAAKSKLVTFVGYQLRFHPGLQLLRDLLHSEKIGRVMAVRAVFGEYLPAWHPYEDYRKSYAARRDLGGGVILTQIHDIDYLTWLFGFPRTVYCLGGKLSSLEIDVEDTASTLMDCESNGRRVPVHLHQDLVQRQPVRTCEVIGEGGRIFVDLRGGSLQVFVADGTVAIDDRFEFERNRLFLDEMKHFLACLDDKTTSCVTIRDAAKSLQVALAALESLRTGRMQELPAL